MKKRFSTLTVGIIAFLMLATGVAAGGYITWDGSQNFDDSMNTMDKIEYGIGLLKGDLKDEKQSHVKTKTELENLRTQLGLEDGEDSKEALKSLIDERDGLITERNDLQGNINTIALEASKYVVNLNNINGAGPKYKYLVDNVNPQLQYLYAMGGIKAGDILKTSPGNSERDTELQRKEKELEQAIKDMQEVKDKSDSTWGAFDEKTQKRIEEALEDTDDTSGEE